LYAVAYAAGALHLTTPTFDRVLGWVQVSGLGMGAIVGLLWLHRAWERVPAPCRRAYDGRRVEPTETIWKLFIPVYGIYWLFIANIGLCGAVERHLARGGARGAKVPSTLALVCSLVQLVPLVNVLVSPFLWALFMARVDVTQAEADRLDPEAPALPPLGILRTVAIIGGALVVGWGLLVIAFLAVWQFLSPGRSPAPP
jgi:hypothetical protein